MESDAKHTLGKLSVEKLGPNYSLSVNDVYVAACDSVCADNKANAARLAHCWNCHDELVEAVKYALECEGDTESKLAKSLCAALNHAKI